MEVEFSDDELKLIDKLLAMYPDKIIKVLHVLDVSLYVNTYNRLRKLRELEGPEYAKFLGFGWKTKVDLKRENDDGIIFNNKDGTTVNGKVRVLKTTYSGKYDVDVLKRLFAEFKVEQTVLANLFNVTRQFISALIKEKKPSTTSWYSDEITPLEESILELMIEEMELVCEVDDTTVFILKNDNRENCIFIKNADGVKFIKNVPEPYLSEFKEVGFDRYNDTDFKYIKKYINEGYSKGDHIKVSGKELRVPSKMKIREYVEFLGYEYISTNSRTDKEILEIMLKYKCGEDEICFTTQCPEHHMVSMTLNRRGTNIEKFAEKNNYKIVSDLSRSLNAIKGYKEDLIKRQIGNGNEVYLHSYDPLYNKLQGYIKNKYKSIDEFVLKLGFKRVLEVAEGYVKYDWVSEVDQNISDSDKAKFLKTLEPFIISDNIICLPAENRLYSRFYDFLGKKGLKLDEVLMSWGFKKISVASLSELKSIKDKLKEIEGIQGDGSIRLTVSETIQRNNSLIKELKILYGYKCQICGEEFTDLLIDKGNGIYYVEGHHIKFLSTIRELEDEQEEISKIDSYKNIIIVCPHHHKYLHHHHGGFHHIIKDEEGKRYFKNEIGETLEIKLDYHLSE